MVALQIPEELSSCFQKSLSEWWRDESEHFLQRIGKWAGFSRGYNRLKSPRSFSVSRQDDEEDDEELRRFNNFHGLKKSQRRKSRSSDENHRMNCCGRFNYQSNGKFDSTCLETYRYDHSIYFKTIGDIRSSKSKNVIINNGRNGVSHCLNDEEKVEWDIRRVGDFMTSGNTSSAICEHHKHVVSLNGDVRWDYLEQNLVTPDDTMTNRHINNANWPVVNITDLIEPCGKSFEDQENNNNIFNENLNNFYNINAKDISSQSTIELPKKTSNLQSKQHEQGFSKFLNFRKTRRPCQVSHQPIIFGENNVPWPGVLLNYNRNMDPVLSNAVTSVDFRSNNF